MPGVSGHRSSYYFKDEKSSLDHSASSIHTPSNQDKEPHLLSAMSSRGDMTASGSLTLLGVSDEDSKAIKGLGEAVKTNSDIGATGGYVLAVNYYEQQTIGSRNMIQLQCYAEHLNLAVVKPVMKDSFLRTPLNSKSQKGYLKFEDSFNLEEWNAYTEKAAYAPLVKWEVFIQRAPRSVILVKFNYPSLSVINSKKKAGLVTQRAQGERYKSGCTQNWPTSAELAFLEANGFKIVREVCFNFYHGDTLTRQEFDQHLLDGHSNVTVVMDFWRGMGSRQRVLLQDACVATYPIHEHIRPSQRVVRDAEAYIQTHLKGSPYYVAVMGRLEMSLLTVHSKQFSVPYCFKAILSELVKLKKTKHLKTTFLSIDVGKYGTKKWRSEMGVEMANDVERFLGSVYGKNTTVKEWEVSFEDVSSSKDAGYIGLLQKVIVTRARCILFAGGGAFQRNALNVYRQLNPNKNHQCLRVVKSCTSSTKLLL